MSEDGETISAIKNNTKTYTIGKSIQIQAGSNVSITNENGVLTISASDMDTTYQVAVASVSGEGGSAGLMSAADKERLDSIPGESAEVINTDTEISLTLANNTVYYCTSDSISSLTISGVVEGFKYAVLIFNSPSTATTFAMPETGYYCTGSGCTDGTFTPEAGKRYSMAIEKEFDRITIYVVEVA